MAGVQVQVRGEMGREKGVDRPEYWVVKEGESKEGFKKHGK